MDAMVNTPAGKDLAAMATSYKVDRTGKLVITGLRGRTYVKSDPAGSRWIHWVEATGRSYAHGAAPTLEACLRDCWREFVLNSTTFRPQNFIKGGETSKISLKDYVKIIDPVLSSLEGKALNQNDLRFEILKVVKDDPSWNPIIDLKFIWDWPQLKEVFDFIGLEIENTGNMVGGWQHVRSTIAANDDCLLNRILPSKENNRFVVELIGGEEEIFDPKEHAWMLQIQIGGDRSREQDYKQRFIEALIKGMTADKEIYDFTTKTYTKESPPLQIVTAGRLIEHALKHKGSINDILLVDTIDSSVGDDVSVLANLPSPWKERVMQKNGYTDDEIQGISTSKELGLI